MRYSLLTRRNTRGALTLWKLLSFIKRIIESSCELLSDLTSEKKNISLYRYAQEFKV